jgi:hypothetical protein
MVTRVKYEFAYRIEFGQSKTITTKYVKYMERRDGWEEGIADVRVRDLFAAQHREDRSWIGEMDEDVISPNGVKRE